MAHFIQAPCFTPSATDLFTSTILFSKAQQGCFDQSMYLTAYNGDVFQFVSVFSFQNQNQKKC